MISWYSWSICIVSSHSEEPFGLPYAIKQRRDVVQVVVHVERRTDRRGNSQPAVQWPRAVVADADLHTLVVQDLAGVVGVDTVDRERHESATVHHVRRSHDPDPVDLLETAQGLLDQL